MSDDLRKKEMEARILKSVFGENVVCEEREQPDFILRYGKEIQYGVEITELYYDGTSARIKNGTYVKELLEEGKYWHKDDKKKLNVQEVTYFSQDRRGEPVQLPMLFLPKYDMRDYARALSQTVTSKNKKLKKYAPRIADSCMLVIYDREEPFKKMEEREIARQLFTPELAALIRRSDYLDIYLVTGISGESRYIPLKAYLLQSDFILFLAFIRERGLFQKLEETYRNPLLAFGEILLRRGNTVTLGEVGNDGILGGMVVYCGRYGVGIEVRDGYLGVGIFDPFPIQNVPGTADFQLEPDTDFFDDETYLAYEDFVRTKIASTGMNFPTKSGIEASQDG